MVVYREHLRRGICEAYNLMGSEDPTNLVIGPRYYDLRSFRYLEHCDLGTWTLRAQIDARNCDICLPHESKLPCNFSPRGPLWGHSMYLDLTGFLYNYFRGYVYTIPEP